MSLLSPFRESLGRYFSIDQSHIDIEAKLTLGSHVLNSPCSYELKTLLEESKIINRINDGEFLVESLGKQFKIIRLNCLQTIVEAGVFSWADARGGAAYLFTGTFGDTRGELSLDNTCPELILALACFGDFSSTSPGYDWQSILEACGPFVCCYGEVPYLRLAEAGFFPVSAITLRRLFVPVTSTLPRRTDLSSVVLSAYTEALRAVDGPDVTFLRLYRIFELHFAETTKAKISSARIDEVYSMLLAIQSQSELDLLRSIIANSNASFVKFKKSDYRNLFINHTPRRETYRELINWLKDPISSENLPDKCRASLIYYIRCALVHSKIGDGELFLFGPYDGLRLDALQHLVEDVLDLIRSILF